MSVVVVASFHIFEKFFKKKKKKKKKQERRYIGIYNYSWSEQLAKFRDKIMTLAA